MSRAPILFALSIAIVACGGKTRGDDQATDSGGCIGCTDAIADAPPGCWTDPGFGPLKGRPSVSATGGATKWFVVKHLALGLTDKTTGKMSPLAWQQYGFDLDCRDTTADDSKSSINSCHRVAGSPTGILVDGDGGIDNNFGGHVMQTLKSLKSDVEDAVNEKILEGGETLLLRLDNVVGDDNANVPGALYVSGPHDPSFAPRFDGNDVYPVDGSSLVAGDLSSPKISFPKGYMAGGYWVSGDFRQR